MENLLLVNLNQKTFDLTFLLNRHLSVGFPSNVIDFTKFWNYTKKMRDHRTISWIFTELNLEKEQQNTFILHFYKWREYKKIILSKFFDFWT